MNTQDNDQPLGQEFLRNPSQYLQSFIRNMNNQVFLSEYQLNYLYPLLLLRKQSPWDTLKPNSSELKLQVQALVHKKISQVKKVLESLSLVYQQKVKKNTFSQIERLMNILKAKNKSILIQKNMQHFHHIHHHHSNNDNHSKILNEINQKLDSSGSDSLVNIQKQKKSSQNEITEKQENFDNRNINNKIQVEPSIQDCSQFPNQSKNLQPSKIQQQTSEINSIFSMVNSSKNDEKQVMSLFYGIANISNLSTLAMSNFVEYSPSQRFIKFKMSQNYLMTIKNQDEQMFDKVSTLNKVSPNLFIHHIYPYLTSMELFKCRGICRQWMQNIKEAWHSTFKREMFIQLMACEFCKEIEFQYKLIQLRTPFFQKISLLMHALLEIILWDKIWETIQNNTILPQLKKVLIILLKLIGQPIQLTNLNSITQQLWNANKQKIFNIKPRIVQFFCNMTGSTLSIGELVKIKLTLLDDPFMRMEEINSDDKTPLLLVIFIKQLALQQILKNHIFFSQEYLMNTKRKLDNISSKIPQQKGFLQGAYKILLLRNFGSISKDSKQDDQRSQSPNFQDMLSSLFSGNSDTNKPDFMIKSKSGSTSIFLDKATKFDIILYSVRKMNLNYNEQPNLNASSDSMQQQSHDFIPSQNQLNNQPKSELINEQKSNISNQIKTQQKPSSAHPNSQQQCGSRKQLKTVNIYNINLQGKKQEK